MIRKFFLFIVLVAALAFSPTPAQAHFRSRVVVSGRGFAPGFYGAGFGFGGYGFAPGAFVAPSFGFIPSAQFIAPNAFGVPVFAPTFTTVPAFPSVTVQTGGAVIVR